MYPCHSSKLRYSLIVCHISNEWGTALLKKFQMTNYTWIRITKHKLRNTVACYGLIVVSANLGVNCNSTTKTEKLMPPRQSNRNSRSLLLPPISRHDVSCEFRKAVVSLAHRSLSLSMSTCTIQLYPTKSLRCLGPRHCSGIWVRLVGVLNEIAVIECVAWSYCDVAVI